MRLPPWPLSFISPLCTSKGRSATPAPGLAGFRNFCPTLHHSAPITARFQAFPLGPTAALNARSLRDHDKARVGLPHPKPIATALQQKVSD